MLVTFQYSCGWLKYSSSSKFFLKTWLVHTALEMSRPTTIKLPALDLSSAKSHAPLRARARSGSIVKVEEVGERYIDEVLDRSAYRNINADWVNAKGNYFCTVSFFLLLPDIDQVHGLYTSSSSFSAK